MKLCPWKIRNNACFSLWLSQCDTSQDRPRPLLCGGAMENTFWLGKSAHLKNKKGWGVNSPKAFWQLDWTHRFMLTLITQWCLWVPYNTQYSMNCELFLWKQKVSFQASESKRKALVLECQEMLFNPEVQKFLNHGCPKFLFLPFTHSIFLCHFCRKKIQGD